MERFLPLLYLLWVGSELGLLLLRRSRREAKTTRADRASLPVVWGTITVSIVLAIFIAAYWDIRHYAYHEANWIWPGAVLVVLGLVIRWIAIVTLGRAFSVDVAVGRDQRVVTTGLYRFIRHPSYAGGLLSFLGLGLTFANLYSVLMIIVPVTAAFLYRIHVEERALRSVLGEEYARYASRTKRLMPFVY